MPDYASFRIVLDVPAANPQLNFMSYADAFRDIIEGSEPRFSIGIFGGWGAGKTTLMDMIRHRLDQQKCVPVEFSAWRYEKEEHLIVPLLDAIRDALNHWSRQQADARVKTAAERTARTIGGVTESILRGFSMKVGIPAVLDLSFDANKALSAAAEMDADAAKREAPRSFYFASFQTLKESFRDFHDRTDQARIVVFIDDLDRCLPEGALEVLESMKLFFDFDGFVFVVGLDQQVVEWCIENRYAAHQTGDSRQGFSIRGADYIKKIFQVPFVLPPIAHDQAAMLIEAIVASGDVLPEQSADLRGRVRPHLEHFLAGGNVNIRDIKRFLNSYTLTMKVHQGLDADVVLALQTIAFTADWRMIFDALRVHQEELAAELRNLVAGQDHCLGEIAPELGTIPLSFERYIQPGAPGAVLLSCDNLAQYINLATSATATDLETASQHSYTFIELLRDIAKVRRALTATGPLIENQLLHAALREAHSYASSMESRAMEIRGSRGADALMGQVHGFVTSLNVLIERVGRGDPTDAPDSAVREEAGKLGNGLNAISDLVRQLKSRGAGLLPDSGSAAA